MSPSKNLTGVRRVFERAVWKRAGINQVRQKLLEVTKAKRLHRSENRKDLGPEGYVESAYHVSLWSSAPHACALFSGKAS